MTGLKNRRSGFTLVELILVVALIGISSGVFYSIWLGSVAAYENHMTRLDLWYEANVLIREMSYDARMSRRIDLDRDAKRIEFFRPNAADPTETEATPFSIYQVMPDGSFVQNRSGREEIMSRAIDYDNSDVFLDNNSLQIELTLAEVVFHELVSVRLHGEAYPRN